MQGPKFTPMTNEYTKRKITQALLNQLPDDKKIDIKNAMLSWWLDVRNEGGLRLSEYGYKIFTYLEIEKFEFVLDIKNTTIEDKAISHMSLMLDLTNKLPCPYYVGRRKPNEPYVAVYDSKIAMLIGLYGNIFEYLKYSKSRRYK